MEANVTRRQRGLNVKVRCNLYYLTTMDFMKKSTDVDPIVQELSIKVSLISQRHQHTGNVIIESENGKISP